MPYQQIAEHINSSQGQCVLLLGPELSVNQAGKYYKSYYKELAEANNDAIVRYFEDENIFLFKDQAGIDMMIDPIRRFYKDIGDKTLLRAIARIKFPLIINACPDKSLNKTFEEVYQYKENVDYIYNYNDNDEYQSDGERLQSLAAIPTPTKDKPVIYNIFGDWEVYNSLVYNHKTFYNTVQHLLSKDSIPVRIQSFLAKANSFVFLGFDFNSWHYHLMCHKLGLGVNGIKKSFGSRSTLGDSSGVQVIMKDYFKMNFVENNPLHTIQSIMEFCEEDSLREQKSSQPYGVYISYAWADAKIDILDLFQDVLGNNALNNEEKAAHIRTLIIKSGKHLVENDTLEWLVQGQNSANGETLVDWYENLPSINKTDTDNYNRESVVDLLEEKLKAKGIPVFRDKNEITYGDSIDSFMNRIGEGKAVIRVISDKYLRSRYCMDEALRIKKYTNKDKRVFTIVLKDSASLDINTKLGDLHNIEYMQYWGVMLENIYSGINEGIKNSIDRERVKRHYSVYIDIYDYIIEFIKSIQDEVRAEISTPEKSMLALSPSETFSTAETEQIDQFIKTVITKLEER